MYEKLHQILKQRSITLYRLAIISNISSADIYTSLSGKQPLYPNWRKRIAEALEMSVEELFSEEERADVLID